MRKITILLMLLLPRLAVVGLWFQGYIGRAYDGILWPVLGFLFAPFTTLAYAWAKNSDASVGGIDWVVIGVAVLVDLATLGGPARSRAYQSYFRR